MDFIDQMKELSDKVSEQWEYVETEEATKNALVMPFIRTLGYDVFNPNEVVPEYTCDAPGKGGEKVDYAIMKGEKPFMLVECKFAHDDLQDKHAAQLHKYFNSIPELKIGVLTNGVIYKFYTDLENTNIMDEKTFLEFDMRDIDGNLVEKLRGFRKKSGGPDPPTLKYTREIKMIFEGELSSPSDKFVTFFASQVYNGRLTKAIKKKFEGIIQNALNDSIDERFKDRIKPVIIERKIVTTEEELKGLDIVREITNPDRVDLKDTEKYCNVILDGNTRKLICRFYFDHEPKCVGFFDHGVEDKVPIGDLSDLRKYAEKLKATVRYHDGVEPPPIKVLQLEFWNGFKEYVQSKPTPLRLKHKARPQHWYTVSLGRPKAHIDLSVNTKSNLLACEIYIPDSKELFNELLKHKDEIEDELNEELEWVGLPAKNASRIKISKAGNIKEPDERDGQFEWFKTQAESFQKVFPKYIR